MKMRRMRPGRLLLVVFCMGFAIFFGLDLATRGIERVQGPVENAGKPAAIAHQPVNGVKTAPVAAPSGRAQAGPSSQQTSAKGSAAKEQTKTVNSKSSESSASGGQPKIEMKESFLNHLSNRVGDALRRAARALVGLVVSIFNSIIS